MLLSFGTFDMVAVTELPTSDEYQFNLSLTRYQLELDRINHETQSGLHSLIVYSQIGGR